MSEIKRVEDKPAEWRGPLLLGRCGWKKTNTQGRQLRNSLRDGQVERRRYGGGCGKKER